MSKPVRIDLITEVTRFARENKYDRTFASGVDWELYCGDNDLAEVEKELYSWLKKNGWDFRRASAEVSVRLHSLDNSAIVNLCAGKKGEDEEDE